MLNSIIAGNRKSLQHRINTNFRKISKIRSDEKKIPLTRGEPKNYAYLTATELQSYLESGRRVLRENRKAEPVTTKAEGRIKMKKYANGTRCSDGHPSHDIFSPSTDRARLLRLIGREPVSFSMVMAVLAERK
ncbi:hypothetical protein TNCV_1938071 [Trichonephila clavipes]|nr:hypothetical protein TNCV_1938071 [Trichonephila clavipes]